MTSSLQICRLFALASTAAAGIAVLSLGVRLKSISLSEDESDGFLGVLVFFQHQFSPGFEVFGIAVGAIATSTALVMLIVDHLRTGAFTSMVVVELVWSSILGALWLAEGVLGAHLTVLNFDNFSCDVFTASLQEVCNETQAIMGIAFGAWVILHIYAITLLVFALRNKSRGASIWTSSLKQHVPQVSETHSATQGFRPLIMTQSEPESEPEPNPEPDQCPAQGEQQPEMAQTPSNAAPTLAPSSRGNSDAPPPYPYGRPLMGTLSYTGIGPSSVSLGYHGHPQLY